MFSQKMIKCFQWSLYRLQKKKGNMIILQRVRKMALKKEKLVLNSLWCKGCGVCAAFCPKGVLALEGEKIVIKEIENCIYCGMCEPRCPDFALHLEEVAE